MRIFAVDDDTFVLEILRGKAARLGYPEVTSALSAGAASKAITAAQQKFQCILPGRKCRVWTGSICAAFCDDFQTMPSVEHSHDG